MNCRKGKDEKPDMKKPDKRNDVTALNKAIFHLVEKNAFEICLIVILGISLYARIVMIPNCVLSANYNNFIVPWVNKYRELGIINGLATKIGDYYVPYNVLLAFIAQLPCEPYLPLSVVHLTTEYLGAFSAVSCHPLSCKERLFYLRVLQASAYVYTDGASCSDLRPPFSGCL